ncbi:MAG: hypothetical protein M3316_03225 [Actinomycetota bacterium]|nr:hypothetical protein [Actinomycetota bacterium]
MAKEAVGIGDIAPGIIVRHTNRRLGKLEPCEACERLISGRISFSEFVDQVGDGYRELLDFMMEHDLHPGRPEEVLSCIDCHADLSDRDVLRSQLEYLYSPEGHQRVG